MKTCPTQNHPRPCRSGCLGWKIMRGGAALEVTACLECARFSCGAEATDHIDACDACADHFEDLRSAPALRPRAKRTPSYQPISSMPPPSKAVRLASAADVYKALADIQAADREHFVCFDLDVRHKVIARRTVAIGSLTGVEVHPREVFRGAIANGAASIIIAHNHPSGDPSPSRQDLELTARLREVGTLLGIQILDHVIVAALGFCSLAERGWL